MKTDLQKLTQTLDDFCLKHSLKEEAERHCRVAMTNCIEDDNNGLGGFSLDEIKLDFVKHELVFRHYLHGTPFVKTEIGLYKTEPDEVYIRDHEPIGYYQLDTDLNGEHFDDWLIIDEEKNNQMNIVSDIHIASEQLPEKHLRRNSAYYEYISYIAHVTMHYQTRQLRACQYFMIRAFEFLVKTEIEDDFKSYANHSKEYIKKIATYMEECHLIDDHLIQKLRELTILK